MRFMTFATAGVFLLALLTMAMWPENARFGSPSRSVAQEDKGDDPFADDIQFAKAKAKPTHKAMRPSARTIADQMIREKLNQKTDLIYQADPFGDVRVSLSQEHGMNVVIDVNLDGVLDDDTEVSANLKGIRLADGLRMLLRAAEATFVVKDGVLQIISIDDENEPEYLSRQMIDVREILRLIKINENDRIGKPIANFGGGVGGGFGGGGFGGGGQGGGGGVFRLLPQGMSAGAVVQSGGGADIKVDSSVDGSQPVVLLTAEHLLIETIQRVVESDGWEQNGSGNGDLTCIGGVLVVVSSESTVEELRDFIVDLEYEMKNRED